MGNAKRQRAIEIKQAEFKVASTVDVKEYLRQENLKQTIREDIHFNKLKNNGTFILDDGRSRILV